MNKKIIRTISWILLFLFINQGYDVKAVPIYPNDGPWVIISRDSAYPADNDKLITDSVSVSSTGKDLNTLITDLINAGEKHIYIEDGVYNLNGILYINSDGVTILGESKTNTEIKQTQNTVSIKVNANNVQVANLNIDGSAGREVFHAQNVEEVSLEECIIYGSITNSAIAFYGDNTNKSKNNSIKGNEIYAQLPGAEKDGIIFYNQKNGTIVDNFLIGSRIGINVCEDSKVINNNVKDSETGGIRITVPATNNEVSYNNIENTKEAGIAIVKENSGDANSIRFEGIKVTNNNIKKSKYFGIEVRNLKNAIISDNTISEIDFEGIYLLYSDNITVEENAVSNCGLSLVDGPWKLSLNSGIFLDVEVKNSNIENNIIHNDSNCPSAIRIQDGANNSNNTIFDNIITGNFIKEIWANMSSPEYTKIIQITAVTPNSIAIKWGEVDVATEYEIEVDGNPVPIDVGLDESYIDTGLGDSSAHDYRVRIKGGQWSGVVTATTISSPSPIVLVPQNITTSTTASSIQIEWDEVTGATEYEIEVDENPVPIDVGLDESYVHAGLENSSTHNYRVRIKGGQWSNVVTATTTSSPPSIVLVPQNITTSTTASSIQIEWDEVTGATGYEIELDGNVVVDVGLNKKYMHNGLVSNSTHSYRVRIKSGQWSSIVIATASDSKSQSPETPVELPQKPTKSSSKKHKSSDNISNEYNKLEFAFGNKKTLFYQNQLIKDIEENKSRRILLYTFEEQYYLGIKMWKNNQIVMNTKFEINLIPNDVFTDSEIKNISIDRNDHIDTILVRDMDDYIKLMNTDGKTGVSEYSIANGYIFSIENTGIQLQRNQKYINSIQ